ncbi:MAG TPA: hypothetical protein VFI42_10425 [Thermomicrobiaceae bacterium]|nr:hypothetical protein [Thermomicrobiaceae bacterium]
MLPTETQALFRALSVFAGGFTLDAVEAVANPPRASAAPILNDIRILAEHYLIQREQETDDAPRFRMLELVCEFAQEQLDQEGETRAIQQTHAEYFARWAKLKQVELYGPDRRCALRSYDREHTNLRAALEWCRKARQPLTGLRLAAAASEYWRERGLVREGYSWLHAFFPVAREAPEDVSAEAAFRLGTFAFWLGNHRRAQELGEELLANSRGTGYDEGIGKALYLLASRPVPRDPLVAISRLEEAIDFFERASNPHWVALCQGTLARWAMELGQFERATCRRLGHDWGAALALNWLGHVDVAWATTRARSSASAKA